MSDRTEEFPTRTLEQFIGRGLYPCNECLRETLQSVGTPLFGRRVYQYRSHVHFSMGRRPCKSCGFFVLPYGTITTSADLGREMREREAKADCGRPDATTNAGTQVQEGARLLMRHGDSKTEFSTGAKRDTTEGKGAPSLISPVLIHRLGVLLQEGAKHYGADNWTKGMPYRRTADSMIRHIYQWLAGDTEEDHLAAACFGAMCLMTYESDRVLDQKLDDRDEGLKKILASILTPPPEDATLEPDEEIKPCLRCPGKTLMSDGVCLVCREREKNDPRQR